MGLRDQIIVSPETLSDVTLAAEDRFRDAEELLYGGRNDGAVYMLGLACEMWLKLACFRFRGGLASDEANAHRAAAKNWMIGRGTDWESGHSMEFWVEYLIQYRIDQGNPLPPAVETELRSAVIDRLFEAWKIDMRYRQSVVSTTDAWGTYNDAIWLRTTHDQLWR